MAAVVNVVVVVVVVVVGDTDADDVTVMRKV